IRELLQLRQEESELLGYRNFAELSLVPKMAGSPEEVISFLRDLGHRARPSAAADLAELREFAAQELGIEQLQAWDVPFAGERLGAGMDDARQRWLRADGHGLQTPVAHLVCNFAAPINGRPALLTHDNVITLFHEFGHGLHHMLTQVEELGVSGISGVEWD